MKGELTLTRGKREAAVVRGAPYPARERTERADRQPRPIYVVRTADMPVELREVSPSADVARADDRRPGERKQPVRFHGYFPSDGLTKSLTNAADMSGSAGFADAVLMSGNWFCDASGDGGATWKRLDPTTIFPETLGGGFCCDQVITYVPEFDRFVWFLQYRADGMGQGAFRIAAASAESVRNDPTAWTYWDFLAGDFGFATNDMDYPDVAFSDEFLYVSTDVIGTGGRLVVRIPLADLASGGTIGFEYTDPAESKTAWGAHLVQQTRSQAVWVGHVDNSTLEVFTMPDGGTTYSSFRVSVAGWPNGSHSSTGPDGNDWLKKLLEFPNFDVTGGVERHDGNVALAWSASKGKGPSGGFEFPQTHVRVAEIDMRARSLVSEMQVWNPDYAFAYPALAANAADEVGIILGWGGASAHANCAMGILGDFVVWFRDDSTRTVERFGDYLTTRPTPKERTSFDGFGYSVLEVAGQPDQCEYRPFYVRYGR